MHIGGSIYRMVYKSTLFKSEVKMDSIMRIGSLHIPSPGHLNMLSMYLVKDKDKDGDKALSAEELDVPEDVFTKIDINGDGNTDSVELNIYYPISKIDIPTLHLIKDKDTDGDKVLSGEELGVSSDILKEIDTNGDGNADREELNAAHPLARFYNTLSPAKDMEASKNNIDVIA